MIHVENLTKYYDDLLAVDHINFDVRKGEIFGFLGPNGAGKTTTVRMLSCLTKITEGEAYINGYSVKKDKKMVKKSIGVVQDTANLYGDLTVKQNLKFIAELYGVDRKRVNEIIKEFELPADRKFEKLSFGFKKRATLAAAVLHNPPVLFLDEPTVGLDVRSSYAIQKLILRLNKEGHTIFLTTHNMQIAEKLSHRIAIINKGKIVAIGNKYQLKTLLKKKIKIEVEISNIQKQITSELQTFSPRIEGNKVIFFAEDVHEFLEQFYQITKKYNIKTKSINTVLPSIEDVFLEVTK